MKLSFKKKPITLPNNQLSLFPYTLKENDLVWFHDNKLNKDVFGVIRDIFSGNHYCMVSTCYGKSQMSISDLYKASYIIVNILDLRAGDFIVRQLGADLYAVYVNIMSGNSIETAEVKTMYMGFYNTYTSANGTEYYKCVKG